MRISLNIDHCCIETAARKKHEALIRKYLKKNPAGKHKKILEDKINALKFFLERSDFSDLRYRCSHAAPDQKEAFLIVTPFLEDIHVLVKQIILRPSLKTGPE